MGGGVLTLHDRCTESQLAYKL